MDVGVAAEWPVSCLFLFYYDSEQMLPNLIDKDRDPTVERNFYCRMHADM
jgi:hypothetical protein